MIRYFLLATIALVLTESQASACVFLPPPLDEAVSKVAVDGVVISGTLVRPFDAKNKQPEIIRADTIYVGEGSPRDFVIYRPERDFDIALGKLGDFNCIYPSSEISFDSTFDRLVLVPAQSTDDPAADGKWMVYRYKSFVDHGLGLDLLIRKAKRLGRFQSRPPRDPRWQD